MAIKLYICPDEAAVAKKTAEIFINEVKTNPKAKLGFATGSSPLLTYNELIKDYETNNTDWSNIITFNLDEYLGLNATNVSSYHYFMHTNLFDKLNLNKDNIHIPNGLLDPQIATSEYENLIIKNGGIDLQLLGLGINGHIAFNEPGSPFDGKTHIADLTQSTINANSRFFKNREDVPTKAITMGIGTILNAKKIVLIATGEKKADAVKSLLEGERSTEWPCTALQQHNDVTVVVDTLAAEKLHKTLGLRIKKHAAYNYK